MSIESEFKEWLLPKLRRMEFDEDIFGSYIMGILNSEETVAEKRESLRDFLSGAAEQELSDFCDEICDEWCKLQNRMLQSEDICRNDAIDLGEKLANIIEKQTQSVATITKINEAEKQLKDAILAQYSQVSDDEGDENPSHSYDESGTKSSCSFLGHVPQNVNVQSVISAEKDQREKSKVEFEKKKAQDKLNREKQKLKQQERREKERKRTQKGEHRR